MCSSIIQEVCKGIHRQLFACPKINYGCNCGPFAIAFAAETLDGKSPIEACFDVETMREHLTNCLENEFLILFPKV